ncbi:hypothetical protein ACHAW6_009115 [Cyclotella cf. meneghiniana]
MKLYMSLALLLLAGNADADTNGTSTEEACNDESGYEVWQSRPPEDAKVKFEGRVDCDAETYTLTYSFEPDMNLPFINNVTKDDWTGAAANPEKAAICAAEGLGPGLSEHVPEGTHVGQNMYYTDYSYSYETTKRIQEATGFKLLTIGAGPCGTPTQPYPHYSIHFYTIGVKDRKKMLCRSNGGYFCRPASEQCSEAGLKFNLDGQGIERCEDNVTYANVPPGFSWTIDGNAAIGINAGSPGMGLHGLIPSDLAGGHEPPLLLMVQYDSNIVANHIVIWGGLPLGQNDPGSDFHWSKATEYNCHDTQKYPTLPFNTTVDYVATEGRTYISISGPTDECVESFTEMWDSTAPPTSKSGKAAKNSKTEKFGDIF